MSAKSKDPVRLGIFVLAGAILLLVGIYLIGNKQNLFSSTIGVNATFHQVNGLRPGNNVRYMGINVGTVDRIEILSDSAVLVEMRIRSEEVGHIRTTAIASLGSDGLMGSRLVNLTPGNEEGSAIGEGTTLSTKVALDTDVMMETLGHTNKNLAVITDEVRILVTKLNTPGNAMDLLGDTLLAQDIEKILGQLSLASKNTRHATSGLDALLTDINAGKGAIGLLARDPGTEEQVRGIITDLAHISDSLQVMSAEMGRFTTALNSPGGLAHALTADTAMTSNVRRTLARLDTSTTLLNEDLRALQRNFLFRKYFKEKAKEEKKENDRNE